MATKPQRIRLPVNLTLNPAGVEKLRKLGKLREVPETNLSRLVDDAISDYVERNGKRRAK